MGSSKLLSSTLTMEKKTEAHKAGQGYKMIAKWLWLPPPSVHPVPKKWRLTGNLEVKISFRKLQKNTSTLKISIKSNGFRDKSCGPMRVK